MRESSPEITQTSNQLVSTLLSTLNESQFFKHLSDFIAKEFKQDHVVIYKATMDGHSALQMCENEDEGTDDKLDSGLGVAAHVVRTKRPYYSNSLKRDPLYKPCTRLYKGEVNAELSVPIICENKVVIGTIHLRSSSNDRQFNDADIEKIKSLLDQMKAPISNMQIYLSAKQLNEVLLKKIEEKEQQQKAKRQLNFYVALKSVPDVKILGKSKAIQSVLEIADKVAPSTSAILFSGEAGSGKEMLAKRVHRLSLRSSRPFVMVNCSSLGQNGEATLDGEECPIREVFRAAQGGTIFFKNISELSVDGQMRLLRIIQENEVLNENGSKNGEQAMTRIISSSSADLLKEVEAGKFLDGLYYRLFSVQIKVPSLSARDEDILVLSDYFLNQNTKEEEQKIITPKAMKICMSYNWPGNIRQLQKVMESIKIVTNGKYVDECHLPEELKVFLEEQREKAKGQEEFENVTLESLEKRHICSTLDRLMGNKTHAAKVLGITVKTLYNKLHAYGMI